MNKTYEINYHSEGISQLDNIKRDTIQKFPNFSNLITIETNNNPQNSTNVRKRGVERGLNSIMEKVIDPLSCSTCGDKLDDN